MQIKGLIKNHEVEIIGRDIDKLKIFKKNASNNNKSIRRPRRYHWKKCYFCVKPYALQSVSARLQWNCKYIIINISWNKIRNFKKKNKTKHYIRTMPNIAASVQNSMTTITGDNEAKNLAVEIFNSIGQAIWVNTEAQLDIATAIAGSGPAYLALVAEALADGAVKAGLERHLSMQLVQGLFSGTASIKHTHPAIIKDSVMSPGGTTAAGYAQLEEHGVRNAMIKAVEEAYNKA